jgi:hypothetical protein
VINNNIKGPEFDDAITSAGLKRVRQEKEELPAVISFQEGRYRSGSNTGSVILSFNNINRTPESAGPDTLTPNMPMFEIWGTGSTENCWEEEILPGGALILFEHHEVDAPRDLRAIVFRFRTTPL